MKATQASAGAENHWGIKFYELINIIIFLAFKFWNLSKSNKPSQKAYHTNINVKLTTLARACWTKVSSSSSTSWSKCVLRNWKVFLLKVIKLHVPTRYICKFLFISVNFLLKITEIFYFWSGKLETKHNWKYTL